MISRSGRGWLLVAGASCAGVGAIAACVGSDPEPANTTPPPPAPTINITAPPVTTASPPPAIDDVIDASLPEASSNDCADGKPHDFCTTFSFPFTPDDLKKLGFTLDEEQGGKVDLTAESFISPPTALRTNIPSRNTTPGAGARLIRAAPFPRDDAGRQPPVRLQFRVRLRSLSRYSVLINTMGLALSDDHNAHDLLSLAAEPTTDDPSVASLSLYELDIVGHPYPNWPSTITPLDNVKLKVDTWSTVTISVTERAKDNPGAVTLTVDDASAQPVVLMSKSLTPVLYTWFGLFTAAYADGGAWQAEYDDVIQDWAPR